MTRQYFFLEKICVRSTCTCAHVGRYSSTQLDYTGNTPGAVCTRSGILFYKIYKINNIFFW